MGLITVTPFEAPFVINEPGDVVAKYGVDRNATVFRLINFETAKHKLRAEHETFLRRFGAVEIKSGSDVFAIGHASRDGPDSFNLPLSERRANAVAGLLQRVTVGGVKVRFAAKGETEPIGKTIFDKLDRAVVVVVQPGGLPLPRVVIPQMVRELEVS
ncbi:MAG: OmpA family protein, partial [Ramlibacter sp.]